VDDLVNKLLLCVRNVGKDQPIDPDANPEIKNILQNFWQVHDAFIEKIIVDLPAENKSRYDIKALRDAVKPHIQSCVCLNRTPENFALKVEEVIRNYLLDGELVEVLKGNLSSPNSPQLIDAIQKYLKKVALGKLRCEVGEVDDLIQTTWVRLLEKLDGFHFLSRFRVWAVTILFQTYCDDVRHQKSKKAGGRFKKVSLFTPVENDDSGFTIGETLPTPELDPEREWLFNSLFDLVSAHLEQYQSELYKKIGGEGILRQDKVEDIAKELNLPAQKVSAILFKIRQKLRQDPNIRPAK
jgi:RNA polymerase sigma factor (sigma-70 family)